MEWVRLDPGSELIAEVELRQPEAMLAAQLERSKDVQAQSAAVAGLAAQRPVTYGVVNALRACMQNSNVYCRCLTSCPAYSPSSTHAQLKGQWLSCSQGFYTFLQGKERWQSWLAGDCKFCP